ncbi:MAG: hypothetical protein GY757_46275, partial [bacterium]|nr:hypothetical protein [bacterium]
MSKETKNQTAWKKIDDRLDFVDKIKETGEFYITAKEIKKVREPRLMAKFDHRVNRPQIFKDNDIAILPITGSSYKLLNFDSYMDSTYNENQECITAGFMERFQSIDINDVRSEDKAIIIAHISGMIQTFSGEKELRLTNKGKFGTKSFDFDITTHSFGLKRIEVNSVGAELDAGFEGDKFYIIEAKMGKIDDFNIRQLYYPYRYWSGRIKKEVVPLFFTYSDNTFSFWEYRFREPGHFNSIQLVRQKSYYIDTNPKPDAQRIIRNIKKFYDSAPSDVPFPQADDFEKVINIVEFVRAGITEKEDFAELFTFDERQADYYFNAAKYLDLVEKNKSGIVLTGFGRQVVEASRNNRHSLLIEAILSRKVFYDTYLELRNSDMGLEKEQVTEL